jgi:hypothetical protein
VWCDQFILTFFSSPLLSCHYIILPLPFFFVFPPSPHAILATSLCHFLVHFNPPLLPFYHPPSTIILFLTPLPSLLSLTPSHPIILLPIIHWLSVTPSANIFIVPTPLCHFLIVPHPLSLLPMCLGTNKLQSRISRYNLSIFCIIPKCVPNLLKLP